MADRTATPVVPWLDPQQAAVWRALMRTTIGLLGTLDNELQAAHGLSMGDYEVLVILSESPERSLRMTDLAGRLRLSPSGITRRIDGLVRDGFVERHRCPTDRRGSYAVLTDTGLARLEEAAPTHVRGVRTHFIDRLSERQLENLADVLAQVEIDDAAAAGSCDNAP